MSGVAITAAASVGGQERWEDWAGDLALAAVERLNPNCEPDALFVAAPFAALEGESNIGAILADRMGLSGSVSIYQLESGDASGAAALHAAYAQIRAGMARKALVVGVSKVSDRPEGERNRLLDALIDGQSERSFGLTYHTQCGLLADLYLSRHRLDSAAMSQVVAKNSHNACKGKETFLKHAITAAEAARDIPHASPLMRSDFAPLLDGAVAVQLTDVDAVDTGGAPMVEIDAVSCVSDWSVLADRAEPLEFKAVQKAADLITERVGRVPRHELIILVHNPCTIVEVLALESLRLIAQGRTPDEFEHGLGRIGSELPINPDGGCIGLGHWFGVSGLQQAREAFLQLSNQAEGRQVSKAVDDHNARVLSLSISGLGTVALATLFRRSK